MNCKLGGAAWMVKIPVGGCMTVGFDVNHDSTNKRKSYGAFVAALDVKEKPRFFSSVSAHETGEECSNNIAIHMRKELYSIFKIYFNLKLFSRQSPYHLSKWVWQAARENSLLSRWSRRWWHRVCESIRSERSQQLVQRVVRENRKQTEVLLHHRQQAN